jgi:hypothetical protein
MKLATGKRTPTNIGSGSIVKHHAKHMAQMRRHINAKTRGDSGSHVTVRSAKNIVNARGPC